MYFLNESRTLCHILEDEETGEAPDPCGAKAKKLDLIRFQAGKPNSLLPVKPANIPLCKHCEKAMKGRGLSRGNSHLPHISLERGGTSGRRSSEQACDSLNNLPHVLRLP